MPSLTKPALVGTAIALLVAATPALAHPGHGEDLGLVGGLLHPFTGLDHMAAMLMVGIWACRLPITGRWRAPAAFMLAMTAGFGLGRTGLPLPAEGLIALSLVALPAIILLARRLALASQMAVVGLFGVAHGAAHGAEMTGPAMPFFLGMLIATLMLHAAGYLAAETLARHRQPARL